MQHTSKILIPTDLTIASLAMVREVVESEPDMQFEIILAYGVHLPNSISDRLFFSKRKMQHSLENEDFKNACRFLHSKYQSQIAAIHLDLITFNTKRFMSRYLEANEIEKIYLPSNGEMNPTHKSGFDICSILMVKEVSTFNLDWCSQPQTNTSRQNEITDLFFQQPAKANN